MSGEIAEQAVAEDAAPVEAPVETPVEETPDVEAAAADPDDIDPGEIIAVPDSSAKDGKVELVPLSAVTKAREKLATVRRDLDAAKAGTARAQELEARVDALSQQLAQLSPKAQAYDAALAAQQMRGPQPQQRTAADLTELQEIARDYDFYTPDGNLDLGKAERHQARVRREATTIAQQHVAPLAAHTIQQQSRAMLDRAKATTAPNGQRPDPAILEQIWSRLDPSLTATLDGAKQAYSVAMGYSAIAGKTGSAAAAGATTEPTRNADGTFTSTKKIELAAPLHTERAGGKTTPSAAPLSAAEKQYCKDMGMSEQDYVKSAQSAPWLRR